MEKHNIKLLTVTMVCLWRTKLITKEKMESYCLGKESLIESINDNLESFIDEIQRNDVSNSFVETYFLPKLTKNEMRLLEHKDTNYLKSFMNRKIFLWMP